MILARHSRARRIAVLAVAVVLAIAGCAEGNDGPVASGRAGSETTAMAGSNEGSGVEPEAGSETTSREEAPSVSEPDPESEVDSGPGSEAPTTAAPDPDCIPGDVAGNPIVQPDRRHEDIIFYLTGERQTGDLDPVEETIDDPNFGGVWGVSGAIVVAVLDCSVIDADEIARIAGGPQYLHLIEVSHTFKEVDGFVDELAGELIALGIGAGLPVDSTLTGRHITVLLPDPSILPDDFGAGVPDHLFSIVAADAGGEM